MAAISRICYSVLVPYQNSCCLLTSNFFFSLHFISETATTIFKNKLKRYSVSISRDGLMVNRPEHPCFLVLCVLVTNIFHMKLPEYLKQYQNLFAWQVFDTMTRFLIYIKTEYFFTTNTNRSYFFYGAWKTILKYSCWMIKNVTKEQNTNV